MKLTDFKLQTDQPPQDDLLAQLQEFNQTRTDYPRDATVHQLFSEMAVQCPDAVAVVSGETSLTWAALDRDSNQTARLLVDQGVQPEDVVAVLLNRSTDMLVALLGILKAGAAYLPIGDDLPHTRIRQLLRDARAVGIVSQSRFIRMVNKLQWQCPQLHFLFCIDSENVHDESEGSGHMMREETWDFICRDIFDDISGGGWRSSYTGEWLSFETMAEYGENIRTKLTPLLTAESRVLEIGCSSGISMFRLAPMVKRYVGTDLSAKILSWTEEQRRQRGLDNISLHHLAAHQTDQLSESGFDLVVMNSVIQCFSGHNYFRGVLRQAIDRMNDNGVIFLGNLWDQDLEDQFVDSLQKFERENATDGIRTKTDRYEELFLSRDFFNDLRHEFPEIVDIEFSGMLGEQHSELSEYGYDAILRIDRQQTERPVHSKHKAQCDRRTLAAYSCEPLPELSHPLGMAYVMYTSGTTGIPKGVTAVHRGIVRLVRNANYLTISPEDCILTTGSLGFDASTFEIWGALLNGALLCLPDDRDIIDGDELTRLIDSHGVTTVFLTTGLFNLFAGSKIEVFKSLSTVLTGGEKLSLYHANRVRQTFPDLTLLNVYGPTENTTFTTTIPLEHKLEEDAPIGFPLSNTTTYVLDDRMQPVPVGVSGELYTGGDGLARGYLFDAALTADRFVPNPFVPGERLYRTGDRARWRSDGSLDFDGRVDAQVKIRGYRIEPAEIELQLLNHESVREAVVDARLFDTDTNTKVLIAWIRCDDGCEISDLRDHLDRHFPDYMIPSHFVRVDAMPLNSSGKIDRRQLPAPSMAADDARTDYVAPMTDTEKRLTSIWEEVLGHSGIGVTDDFFSVGGHSLRVAKLVALIEQQLGVIVPLTAVFRASTIRELAQSVLDAASFGLSIVDESMVRLSGDDSQPRLFAFPPGTGDAAGFIQLAERLPEYAFYGFNFIRDENRLQQYADLIQQVDPDGPYVFFGYSSGGNLAYHVAREMEQRGCRVVDIVMVDSGRKLVQSPFTDAEIQSVADDFLNHESNRPYLTSPTLREKMVRQVECNHRYIANAVDYHRVQANIHVLLSEDFPDVYTDANGVVVSTKSGWADVTDGQFALHEAVGTHNQMLYSPALDRNVEIIAGLLERAFERVTEI